MNDRFSYFDVIIIGGSLFWAGRGLYEYAAILCFSAAMLSCFIDCKRGDK